MKWTNREAGYREGFFFSLALQYSVLVLNFVSPSGLMLKD